MYAETPNKIILAGSLGAREITSLAEYCDQLTATGLTMLRLDIGAVTDCDRLALSGLRVLVRRGRPTVQVEGARWGQFLAMLAAEPIADVPALCDSVRELVDKEPLRPATRVRRRRSTRSHDKQGDIAGEA